VHKPLDTSTGEWSSYNLILFWIDDVTPVMAGTLQCIPKRRQLWNIFTLNDYFRYENKYTLKISNKTRTDSTKYRINRFYNTLLDFDRD